MTSNQSFTIGNSYNRNADVVIFQGQAIDFVKSIPEGTVNLIITSPPYNTGKEYEESLSIDEYVETQKEIIPFLCKSLDDTGSICWQVGNYINNGEVFPLDIYFYKMFKDQGMHLRNRIVWRYGHGQHATKRFSGRYEIILWFSKTDNYIFNLDPVRVLANT